MKKIAVLLVALAIISCHSKAQKKTFSEKALSETLLATDGSQVAFKTIIENQKGKNVVFEIWASWCSDCIKAMPKIKTLQAQHPEVAFTFISMDKSPSKWQAGIEKYQLQGNHYMANDQMQGVFGKAIDLDWIPRYIILDKTGKIVLYRAIETDFTQMDELLNTLK